MIKNLQVIMGEFQLVCKSNPIFPQCELVNILKSEIPNMEISISKGDILYRARPYSNEFLEKIFNIFEEIVDIKDASTIPVMEKKRQKIKDEIELRKSKGFYGYDEEGSFVNKNWRTIGSGRCNREFESVLYAAEDISTAISEMKPLINEQISVAEIEIIEELKLIDLCIDYTKKDELDNDIIKDKLNNALGIFFLISPTETNKDAYIYTQVICAIVKQLGYDGIVYSSCQNKDKKNYAIFNYKKCRAISSNIYSVRNISYSIEEPVRNA